MHDPAAAVAASTHSETPLRQARRAAGLSQRALAARVGCDRSSISYFEARVWPMRQPWARRLADVLGVALEVLLPEVLLAAGARFDCQRLHCKGLPVAACLARQHGNDATPAGYTPHKRGVSWAFPNCHGCAQGAAIRHMVEGQGVTLRWCRPAAARRPEMIGETRWQRIHAGHF